MCDLFVFITSPPDCTWYFQQFGGKLAKRTPFMVMLLGECTKCDERRADLVDGFILRILGITTVVFWIRAKALQYVQFVCSC